MSTMLAQRTDDAHRERAEMPRPTMAKADLRDLRKPEMVDFRAEIARVVDEVTGHWTLKEFAVRLELATGRSDWDHRQLARWRDGKERPQFDVLWAIEELRIPLVLKFAALAGSAVEITTHITLRRSA